MTTHVDTNLMLSKSAAIAGSNAGPADFEARWRDASSAQTKIFQDVLARNAELESRVRTLEYEVWKLRSESKKESIKRHELRAHIDVLKNEVSNLKDETPIVACLLDGDGCIFSQEYLRKGEDGGLLAGQSLSNSLMNDLKASQRVPAGAKLVITIFLAKSGMESALQRNNICTPEQFSAFLEGFNRSHPLFSVVDVGSGKEAADHKIRELLELYTRMPQCFKVFFGGAHDNGYHGSLSAIQTMGLGDKLVMLQSYSQAAREIASLKVRSLEIPGLFMTVKLDSPAHRRSRSQTEIVPKSPMEEQIIIPDSSPKKRTRSKNKKRDSNLTLVGQQEVVAEIAPIVEAEIVSPCLYHHMSDVGCMDINCKYQHEDHLSPAQRDLLLHVALGVPCRFLNEGRNCPLEICNFGHVCPRGPRCDLFGQGVCKFVGVSVHE